MVTPPARMGKVKIKRTHVISKPQINNSQHIKLKYLCLQINIVPTIFIELSILDTPSKCTENIVKSQDMEE